MKRLFICFFVCILMTCLHCVTYAQKIPKNPNKTDAKGFRQGKWTIGYNKNWEETVLKDSIVFYRLITYKDDKPIKLVKDCYRSGKVQMEATLLADRPQEIFDGIATWYREDGTKEIERVFKQGVIESEKKFDIYGKEIIYTWQEIYNMGNKEYEKGNYANALQYYELALPLVEKKFTKESIEYTTTLNDIGLCAEQIQNFQKSEQAYIECKNIREKILGKEHSYYASSCNNLGYLYYNKGLYSQAEFLYIEANQIWKKILGDVHPNYALSCNNLADLYDTQGKYAQAEPLYIKAKNIREKTLGKEHFDYTVSCNNLAGLYKRQGKYEKAKLLYIEAKNIREKTLGKEHINYAFSCNNLANLYEIQNLYTQAESLYIEAKKICEKVLGKENIKYAVFCNNLASLYNSQGKYTQAEQLYIETKYIWEKILGKEHPNYATVCNNLAFLYSIQSLYAQAELLYIEAKNIREKTLGKGHFDFAISCNNLANLYNTQHLYAQAESLYIEGNQAILNQIDRNFSNLSEKEKMSYYSTFSSNLEIFIFFAFKRYQENKVIVGEVYNNRLITKALLFDASNKIRERIAQNQDENLKKLYQDWKNKKEFLAKVYQMTIADKETKGIDVSKLEDEANDIEKQLSSQSELFAKATDKKRYTWQDVQKTLKQGEVAIEIIRFQVYDKKWTDTIKYMALLVMPESKYPEMIVLPNGNELEKKYLSNYKTCIKNKAKDKYSYKQYWQAISEKLKGAKKVYLSVDGIYNAINLNTLQNIETGKYIGEEIEIQLVTNTKDLVIAKNEQKSIREAVLIGFPDYNGKAPNSKGEKNSLTLEKEIKMDTTQRFFNGEDISELLGTKQEVENLENIMKKAGIKIQNYTEEQASEETVKQLNNPQVLHIATHGFFMKSVEVNKDEERGLMGMDTKKVAENPLLRSGLLFANAKVALKEGGDGVLTAYEAMNLNLDNTDLVVLSACETGLGEIQNGEGVYGLQRAFQQAGAKTVLMSLWTVSDEATQELMTLFYENLITKKQSKRLAFQNAQNELKKKFPEPYYWGAFVMVGE